MEITAKWAELGDRLLQIEDDDSLPKDHPKAGYYKTTLSFAACERIIGTRKVSELRRMLADMGFNDKAALAQFRDYFRKSRREAK